MSNIREQAESARQLLKTFMKYKEFKNCEGAYYTVFDGLERSSVRVALDRYIHYQIKDYNLYNDITVYRLWFAIKFILMTGCRQGYVDLKDFIKNNSKDFAKCVIQTSCDYKTWDTFCNNASNVIEQMVLYMYRMIDECEPISDLPDLEDE